MVPLTALWIPILLSAVIVFLVSSVIHMLLPYHRSDFKKLPSEDEVMAALRPFKIAPGDYVMPCAGNPATMKDPEFVAKMEKGPCALVTIMPSGRPTMGTSLALWFAFCVLVGLCAAYLAGRALGPGADYLEVFRFAGCAAFLGYALALLQNSIWYKRDWAATLKSVFDGLIYSLLTAGVFGWLWPG